MGQVNSSLGMISPAIHDPSDFLIVIYSEN